jgi:hypothetical protein
VLEYDPKHPEKTRLFFTFNGFIAWCTASKNHYADLLRKYCTRVTANIHNGDGGQYITKIVERELAARGINPNFQPTLPATAALEKMEALSAKWESQFGAMQAQLVSVTQPVQAQLEAMQSQLDALSTAIPAVCQKPRLYISQVLTSLGYDNNESARMAVGTKAVELCMKRKIFRGNDGFARVYYDEDRELLEEAVQLTPNLPKLRE